MKTFLLNANQHSASFEVRSDEFTSASTGSVAFAKRAVGKSVRFTVTPSTSSVSLSLAPNALAREVQTERINRSLVLGYMPALNATSKR